MVSTVLAGIFGGCLGLLILGATYNMYVKPVFEKKKGQIEELAKTKDTRVFYNKKNKVLTIKCKAGYSNNGKEAIAHLQNEFNKIN